ncbi:MAG: glycosyltransferase family 39 protein [Acidobacteria bacterium]|nr:glycosyltransferase family 39 protein [Acidobacteriota bacterium]MBV9479045.1 glycosyltransferase family 39 protein [Acidobacteriota bacterium]
MLRGRRLSHVLVFLVSLAVKALVLASLHAHPLLQPADDMDGAVYLQMARSGPPPVAYFVSPLYLYFLKLTGASVAVAPLIQILLGSIGVVLLFDTARRWFGLRAAFLSALLIVLTGVVTFDEIEILQSALDPFLVALMLWTLTVALQSDAAQQRETLLRFAAAGAATGLFVLNRPNALIWLAASGLLLLLSKRWRQAAAFAAGCALLLAPVVLRNYVVAHELVLVSSHGGLNFYIGNNEEADGTYHAVRGIRPTIAGQSVDAARVATAAVGHPLTAGEVSRWFYGEAFRWIREHPLDALRLFALKLAYTIHETDLALNTSYDFFRKDVDSPLQLLVIGPWLLVPLGVAGAMSRVRDRRFRIWVAFVPVYALSVALFFVASRYRLPLLLAFAVCAAGIFEIRRIWPVAVAGAAVAACITLWPFGLDSGRSYEETNMAVYLISHHRAEEASTFLARVEPHHTDSARLYLRAGLAYQHAGDDARAIDAFERVLRAPVAQPVLRASATDELAAEYVRVQRLDDARRLLASIDAASLPAARASHLGRIAMQLRDGDEAARFFNTAASRAPADASAWYDLGMADLARGDAADAVAALTRASRLAPNDPADLFALALADAQTGQLDAARHNDDEALRLRPDFPEAQELRERLR